MERALLVTIDLETEKERWPAGDAAAELDELASVSGAEVIENIICARDKVTPNFFIGRGKVQEIALYCLEKDAKTVIFSHDLSGTQQRNLEEVIGRKTIDRTQLILDIFARHARSPEGKMQVELAQLQYLLPRLVGKGIILSRLGGGIGTRGPGEQKLEVDRRRIRERVDRLKDDLRGLASHRRTTRKKRKENNMPTVTLVGYTGAGKSTLLNALTGAGQVVTGSLFTTLDPLYKGLQLPNGEKIIISDTVGFLRNLPHHLIEAFRATLEEVVESDLLIHVLDAAGAHVYERHKAVMEVLKDLKADTKPVITALNKIDLSDDKMWLSKLQRDFGNSVAVSALLKQGLDSLLDKIRQVFSERMTVIEQVIPHSRMDLVDLLHREGKVISVSYLNEGIKVKVSVPKLLAEKLTRQK